VVILSHSRVSGCEEVVLWGILYLYALRGDRAIGLEYRYSRRFRVGLGQQVSRGFARRCANMIGKKLKDVEYSLA